MEASQVLVGIVWLQWCVVDVLSVCTQEHFGGGVVDVLGNLLMCVPLISMCCLRGSTCVSLWRYGIGVVCVQPVVILSALFWVTSSLFMCVVAVFGCHAGWAYVSMGLMYCLYTRVMSYLNWPIVVLVSARSTLRRVFALVFMLLVCEVNLISFVMCHSECGGRVGVG